MKHKPIRVDWNEFEVAFSNHDEEIEYYLDLVTGHVVLDGEGEEFDDEDEVAASGHTVERTDAHRDPTRAYVTPMTTAMKLDWMRRFLAEKDSGLDAETHAALTEAFESDDAPERLSVFLRAADEARDIWYLYRSDRLHEYMQQWLDEHGVTAINAAPWT